MMGFEFRETMSGTYSRLDLPHESRDFQFTITARASTLLESQSLDVEGILSAEGLARSAPVKGTLELRPLHRQIVYRLDFGGDNGQQYCFSGQKDVRVLHLLPTLTKLPGRITDSSGHEIATCVAHFQLGDLLPFLRSFRRL